MPYTKNAPRRKVTRSKAPDILGIAEHETFTDPAVRRIARLTRRPLRCVAAFCAANGIGTGGRAHG